MSDYCSKLKLTQKKDSAFCRCGVDLYCRFCLCCLGKDDPAGLENSLLLLIRETYSMQSIIDNLLHIVCFENKPLVSY
ncbi:hypothetical protein [Treponema lecithinolyticum]|uniref:hypothetical protein n=1 Tax=Treponema lecithinolyticum TaxID=53418 RepID=UPI00361082B5